MTDDIEPRPILRTNVLAQHPWPQDCMIQGGNRGLVFATDGNHYTTAFVEAFPREPHTFIRGEGETVGEAENAAWDKYQNHLACPGHEFEPRGYRNGAGFCIHCNMFGSQVFTAEQLGLNCATCGTPTFWTSAGDDMYCEVHAPPRAERREADLATGRHTGLKALIEDLAIDVGID